MSNTLTLKPSGSDGCTPDQNPWTPHNRDEVKIINNSGYRQTLSNITNGCLIQPGPGGTPGARPQRSISLPVNGIWKGRAGAIGAKGTYTYNDGVDPSKLAPRIGTIDPS